MTDKGFILDTPQQIEMFQWVRVRSALGLEIKTGMKMGRGSFTKYLQRMNITDKRTKRGAYFDLNAFIVAHGGEDRPLPAAKK